MKFIYPLRIFLVLIVLLTSLGVIAQNPTYNSVLGTTANTIPFGNASNKAQNLYYPADFTTVVPPGNITDVYLRTATTTTATLADLTIKLGTTSLTTFTTGAFTTGLTTVYNSPSVTVSTVIDGWAHFVLQTPFFYDGTSNLILETSVSTNSGFSIRNLTITGINSRLYGAVTSATGTAGTGQMGFGFDILQNACTSPPTAGMATSNKTISCSSAAVNLNLSGNSNGLGQTYQWQSSATQSGTYTSMGTASGSSSYSINPTSTMWYRAAVTCNGSTVFSTPVQVEVTPPAAGGTFTINSGAATGGTNFQTFSDAVNYMKCGISGPVVFNVATGSGPYNEQITIPEIIGSSSTNTITINGNGSTISFNSTVSTQRSAITLDGADFVTINNVKIEGAAGTYGWGVQLLNQANNNQVVNNTINVLGSTNTAYNFIGISLGGSNISPVISGNAGNNNLISGNSITGGYYGIILYGAAAAPFNSGNIVSDNVVLDAYSYGIYIYGNVNATIRRNDISRPTKAASTTTAGVFLTTGTTATLVEKNRVHNMFDALPTNTSTFYGIYVASDATVGQENKIINNLVYNIGGNGIIYGLYNSGADFMKAYHNTIVLDDIVATTGAAYGIYQTTVATDIEYKNNISFVSRSGTGTKRAIYFVTTTSTITSNNNDLYINSSSGTNNNLGQFGTTNFATLTDWKTANGAIYDAQSISVDPVFANPGGGDYKPTLSAFDNLGVNVGVTTDIVNTTRNTTSPDIGAFEFDGSACTNPPTAGTAVVTPSGVSCSATTFTLSLSGNTIGVGQLYQWQSSNTSTGTFTNIGTASATSSLSLTATSTKFYRAIVTCGSGQATSSVIEVAISAGLSGGTYTINSNNPTSPTNYQSFTQVAEALKCGILGAVTFNVAAGSGPYTEQMVLGQISGTSATNTITINGNGATISFNSTASDQRAGITLNGTDYVKISNLVIDGSTGTYGWGVHLFNDANNNIIENNTINVLGSTNTAYNFLGIAIGGNSTSPISASNAGNNNTISNNRITGGYYNIVLYGNSVVPYNTGNTLVGNTLKDAYSYSIYLYGNIVSTISRNDISRPTKAISTTTAGVYLSTGSSAIMVESNKIHNMFDQLATSTSIFYGIYLSGDAVSGSENKVINNLVSNIGGNGTQYGIYNVGADSMQAYHNTIIFDDAATTSGVSYGLYQTTAASGNVFRNNNIFITRAGTGTKRAIYFVTTTSPISSNYNNLYVSPVNTNNSVGQYGTAVFATLADWQTANSNNFDQQSQSVDPMFLSQSGPDYIPTVSALDNKGTPVGVSADILSITRNLTTPDIGAYEFTTLTAGINMKAESLIKPAVSTGGCYRSADTVIIRIRNSSTATINFAQNNVTVTTNVSGAVTQTLTALLTSGTLASDSTMDVTMSQTLNMSTPGTYTFNANTTVTGDVNTSNDAMVAVSRVRLASTAGTASASPSNYCLNGGKPTLTVSGLSGFSSIQWQSSTTSGSGFVNIPGATTSTFVVPTAITQTSYYRLLSTCDGSSLNTAEIVVTISNPSIVSTTPASRCGAGSVTLGATAATGATVEWYAAASGGQPLASGNTFTTNVTTTTTFYAAANLVGGTAGASPLNVTEFDIGTNDQLEIQNVSSVAIDVTGWKIALSNNYTDINSVNPIIQTLSGTMSPGDIKTWTDLSSGPNYWGNNILWNPGAFPTFTGWAAILDNNNVLMDIVFLNWPAANIQASAITINGTAINAGAKWTGNGIDITTVASTNSISRQGNLDNNTLSDFAIIPLSVGTLNPGMTAAFTGFGCTGSRVAVTATVGTATIATWTGAINSLWEEPGNWSCGAVPTEIVDVTIPAVAIIMVNSKANVKSLTVNPTAVITVKSGADIMVH